MWKLISTVFVSGYIPSLQYAWKLYHILYKVGCNIMCNGVGCKIDSLCI